MPSRLAVTAPVALALAACAAAGCSAAAHSSHSQRPAARGQASPARSLTPGPGRTSQAAGTRPPGCGGVHSRSVSTAAQLARALAGARAGQTIVLAPGTYTDDFVTTRSGTARAPITLCGGRDAVLEGTSVSHGYVLHLDGASWWRLAGFTVAGGQKGVVTDDARHDLIYGLYVHGTGDEAIHLRTFSSYNTVSHNVVRDTGLHNQLFGEGIYVGSAHKNWCRYSGCKPDASNNNLIIGNNIAGTSAENIDIKEGTTGGIISGNTLSGVGMVTSAATSWINVKGNDWVIEYNTGTRSTGDGYSVHQVYPGWGLRNAFRGNKAAVSGPGYGIYVQSRHLGTMVACNNVASGANGGMSNISCSDL